MSLFRRGEIQAAARATASIDYPIFVATLQALQLSTATARAGSRCAALAEASAPSEPLAEILLGSQCWQDAVVAQGGCFNPAFARGTESR
ncbi:MAG TPA: hypothetical protein VGD10_07115 [Allosphingosinicella sp.]